MLSDVEGSEKFGITVTEVSSAKSCSCKVTLYLSTSPRSTRTSLALQIRHLVRKEVALSVDFHRGKDDVYVLRVWWPASAPFSIQTS